jgi:hypothetical protein
VDRYLDALCTQGYVSANDAVWPEFDGKYVNYPQFKKKWWAQRETLWLPRALKKNASMQRLIS